MEKSWLLRALVCLYLVMGSCGGASVGLGDDNSVEGTVGEVEDLLRKDPGLPRLTRGEILSLIEEVRSGRGPKDLVVVLPFSGNSTAPLEELYTKAPVTEMLHENASTKRPKRKRKPLTKRPVYVPQSSTTIATTTTTEATTTTRRTTRKPVPVKTVVEDWVPLDMRDTIGGMDLRGVTETPQLYVTVAQTERPAPAKPTQGPDVAVAAESLTPDMKDLLVSFGLLKSDSPLPARPEEFKPSRPEESRYPTVLEEVRVSPTVDPTSYMSFKPLPESQDEMSDDMRSFLATFGLVPTAKKRGNKALKVPTTHAPIHLDEIPPINTDILTQDMKDVLEDLGIMEADRRRRNKKLKHVFNPSNLNAELNKTEEVEKINKLLKRIKELSKENKSQSITQEELKELLVKEIGEEVMVNQLGSGTATLLNREQPDPLSLDELAHALEADKNEVKRQEPKTSTALPSTTTTPTSTTTSTTEASTEEDSPTVEDTPTVEETRTEVSTEPATERTPSFDELNESFGGDISTTTPRPNGLYFLLDWNSFLDVGLDQRRVNLQFNPKVGDPRVFLPVTVP